MRTVSVGNNGSNCQSRTRCPYIILSLVLLSKSELRDESNIIVTIHGKRGLLANFNKNEIIGPVHSSDLLAPIYVHFCCHSNITNQIYII